MPEIENVIVNPYRVYARLWLSNGEMQRHTDECMDFEEANDNYKAALDSFADPQMRIKAMDLVLMCEGRCYKAVSLKQ